jgi:hypothetical protein
MPMKNPVAPSGIEPVTCRFVAQLRHRGPVDGGEWLINFLRGFVAGESNISFDG